MASFARQDEGQALVIAGIAMVVLMGALVLGVDWGYRFAVQRIAQNQADAGTLAAGRALATSYDGSAFTATERDIWVAACGARNANSNGTPTNAVLELSVTFFDVSDTEIPGTGVSSASASCANAVSPPVDPSTVYVRVVSSMKFDSLFGMVTRLPLEAVSSARARLTAGAVTRPLNPVIVPPANRQYGTPGVGVSGYTTAPNVAMWPIAVSYRILSGGPGAVQLFWNNGSADDDNFFVTLAHYSPRDLAHELVTESDFSGTNNVHHSDHGTFPLVSSVPSVCGPTWDTNGQSNLGAAASCDIPNWLNYGFRGSVSADTDWGDGSWDEFTDSAPVPAITQPNQRTSCMTRPSWLSAPSCDGVPTQTSSRGDWLETVPRYGAGGVNPQNVHDRMIDFIDTYGRIADNGDRAVVVNVFLWDCAQEFDGTDWQTVPDDLPTTDCSDVDAGDGPLDRLHVFAIVPMTIYHDDVDLRGGDLRVLAHWGGVFGDAGNCRTSPGSTECQLNPIMNSAFLVPDE